ncbi:hypothetical protein Tco_0703490 [Tanacetum coccineum]|uniref:Uncharacterized protein n=1 Tax=Tanacetum coccineum TaxID=301880 RepID=A0ABQ4XZ21_9ASTR
MKRSFQGIHRQLLPAMLTIDAGQPQPSAAPSPSHPIYGEKNRANQKSDGYCTPRLQIKVDPWKQVLSELRQTLGTANLAADRESQKAETSWEERNRKKAKDAAEGFKGSQAPLAQVNTAQVKTAELNPDSTPFSQVKMVKLMSVRLNADQILAEKLQQERKVEQYSIEDRAKFLHDTIAAQRKFLAEQRSATIRNKPPTISQLRNQMITYLKHVANRCMLS